MTIPARISIVTLGVADLPRAVAFYKALGWERAKSSTDEIAWFRTADTNLGGCFRTSTSQPTRICPRRALRSAG